jgi:hypothetical protein
MRSLLASLLLSSVAFAQTYYSAALDGAQEVPPAATTARGFGILRHDPGTNDVRIFVHHEGLTGPAVAAHLHLGAAGVAGGIAVGLTAASPNTFTGTGTLTPAQATALAANGTYLNVHTGAFPGGEIRGQVVPASSTRFAGVLSGAQEVPPVPSTATGTAIAFLHEPENRVVYMVNSTGLTSVLFAHFHEAAIGVSGPIQVALSGTNGTYCGVTDRLTTTQVATWKANGVYANIHTSAFPGGELRAQMLRDAGDHWVARADGAQENPPTPSPGVGSGQLLVAPNGTVTITGSFAGLSGLPVAAHVHVGAVGVNGPIVFPLTTTATTYSGSHTPTTSQLADLRNGLWYVNLHTGAFPGGEVRGQLTAAKLPTTFGAGCLGSNGTRPQAGATGVPVVGTAMGIDLYGALASAPALFAFGGSRDSVGPIPLPFELTLAGINAPNCYVFVDPQALLVVFSDAFGCATQSLTVPFAPALRGLDFFAQWIVLDGAANPGGFVSSSALSIPIQ